MIKIIAIIMALLIGFTTVGCSNTDTTVDNSSQGKQETSYDKNINEAYDLIKESMEEEQNDEMVYEFEKASDGIVIKLGLVDVETFKKIAREMSKEEVHELFDPSIDDLQGKLNAISVGLRRRGVENADNINVYMDICLSDENKKLVDLIYSISTKDGIILDDLDRSLDEYSSGDSI